MQSYSVARRSLFGFGSVLLLLPLLGCGGEAKVSGKGIVQRQAPARWVNNLPAP